ncbi:MAG: hypothetical protein GQ559_11395 [Desulfobulbaceae bacterium]|nr:hypothetical protein [Desulfobulbaceae bacterium]
MNVLRPRIGVSMQLIFVLLLTGCCLCPEPETKVTAGWSYVPEDKTLLTRFVPMAAGGALASTPRGDVYAIDTSGREMLLVEGIQSEPRSRVVFNTTGDTFGILRSDGFTIYDAQGTKLSTQPIQRGMYKLVPSGQRIYSPEVREEGPEDRTVINARILDRLGTVQAVWPAPGLEISRLTSQHLVYVTNTELVKTTLAGTELWRTPVPVRKIKISEDGVYSIINSAYASNRILHYKESTGMGTDTFDGPVWNLAISPGGRYAAATSQTELHIYADGLIQHATKLAVEFAVSVDVNDRGEVLVGGQAMDHAAYVALYDQGGSLLWEDRSGPDNNAWRPEVKFDTAGDHYLVRHKDRLVSYRIERSP